LFRPTFACSMLSFLAFPLPAQQTGLPPLPSLQAMVARNQANAFYKDTLLPAYDRFKPLQDVFLKDLASPPSGQASLPNAVTNLVTATEAFQALVTKAKVKVRERRASRFLLADTFYRLCPPERIPPLDRIVQNGELLQNFMKGGIPLEAKDSFRQFLDDADQFVKVMTCLNGTTP